jgi:formylglycine-generating enzyme required for sulfatase activity
MPRILLLVLLFALPASASTSFRDCEICPEMVMIPAGSFMMGTPDSEPGSYIWERPQRQIPISRSFAAGKYEVTFDEWDACVRERGCSHKPDDQGWGRGRRPVINVAWSDAKEYVAWLSRKTSKAYRLLSEAEWEYAARAGTATTFSFGSTISAQHANYDASHSYAGSPTGVAEGKTVEVGKYSPNAFGLYDVHGNVWEWVEDCYGEYAGAPKSGSARTSGACASRPVRGGSWISPPRDLRSATRNSSVPNRRSSYLGLRVARD